MMGCGSGRPIATQIGAGITSCQIIQSINPNLTEAKLHLQRTINCLAGAGPAPHVPTAGGMQYTHSVGGNENPELGKGIIPDLKKVQGSGYLGWTPADADAALESAQSALNFAQDGLNANDIDTLKKAAQNAVAQLQSAFNYCIR